MFKAITIFCSIITLSDAFNLFQPKPRTKSNREIQIMGRGPPVLFSPGLFGTMPKYFYGELLNNLKKNVSLITINDFLPLGINDIDEIATALSVDKLSLITHSSFDPPILTSERLNLAILCDPISIPTIDFTGIKPKCVETKIPILGIKAEKAYFARNPIPDFQNPTIIGDYKSEIYSGVGHVDILDDFWSQLALRTGLWEGIVPEVLDYKDWKVPPSSKPDRKKYRKYISGRILEFINNTTLA